MKQFLKTNLLCAGEFHKRNVIGIDIRSGCQNGISTNNRKTGKKINIQKICSYPSAAEVSGCSP